MLFLADINKKVHFAWRNPNQSPITPRTKKILGLFPLLSYVIPWAKSQSTLLHNRATHIDIHVGSTH